MVRMTLVSAFLLLVVVVDSSLGKRFKSHCELARELRRHHFNEKDLPNWVCLVFAVSSANTATMGNRYNNRNKGYGLFQINSKYWCAKGHKGGECHVDCYKLLDEDIFNDSACAQLIKRKLGFSAWQGWTKYCEGRKLPDLSKC